MNSGWVSIMGPHPGGSPTLFDMPGGASLYQDPIYSWFNTTGPTGIAFAYGSSFGAAYDDSLLVADFNLPGQIYAFPLDGSRLAFDVADNTAETQLELDQFAIATGFAGRPVATEFGPDGHLYVLSYFDGTIYRIEGPGPSNPVPTSWSPLPLALVLLVSASLVLTNRARRSA